VPERGKGWFAKGRKKDKTRKRRGEKKQTESNTLKKEQNIILRYFKVYDDHTGRD
jgi:hypothetical protein